MKVLVATDGSQYGHWALNWVAMLPFVTPPRVTALHVLDSAWLRGPFRTRPEIQRIEAHAARTLRNVAQQLVSLKLKGRVRKEQGTVAPTILKHSPKRDGLLVVGSRGLDALDRFMLGSVSTKLIQQAPCPVLVIRGAAKPLRRIILATDGSGGSAKALAFVLRKFHPNRSPDTDGSAAIHVSVVHVMPLVMYPRLKEDGNKIIEESARKLVKQGFIAEPVCRFGVPADEIIKVASNEHADLIVMGTRGLSAIARVLLGSVSTGVVDHANCAVLVVR